MANIIDVAKFVLEESARTSRPEVSTMKLQKICYFVQGWHLVINGYPMFTEDFYAWKYGPVSPVLYDFCEDKVSVTTDSVEFANVTPELNDYQQDFIKRHSRYITHIVGCSYQTSLGTMTHGKTRVLANTRAMKMRS